MTNLENYYPSFFCRKPESNFMKINKVLNKSVDEVISTEEQVKNQFTLNKKLQVWKEQKEPHDYHIHFAAYYKNIETVKIYRHDLLIHQQSDVDNFEMKLDETSPKILPDVEDMKYLIVVTLKNGAILKKGFPENVTPKGDEFDSDSGLDCIGKLLECPRRVYKTDLQVEDYPNTEPTYCNFQVESDYDYMNRLAEYSRRYWEEALVCLKVWQYYNLNSKLENRSKQLCTINESYIEPDKEEKTVTGGYIATKENYNAYCYDLLINPDEQIPANLPFTNIVEFQKLIQRYSPITKRIFPVYNEMSKETMENIIISDQINIEKIVPEETYVLNMSVVSQEGKSLSAIVTINNMDRVEVDEGGQGSITLPKGEYTLVVVPMFKDLYLENITEIVLDQNKDIIVTLSETPISIFNIEGYVIDQLTSNPVKALVYVDDAEKSIETHEDGYFKTYLPKGEHDFRIQAENYGSNTFKKTITGHDTITFPIKHEEHKIVFTVVDKEISVPVAGALITVGYLPPINTEADGKVNATLRTGEYDLTVEANGYEKNISDLTVTKDEEITIQLNKLPPEIFDVVCQVIDEDTGKGLKDAILSVDMLILTLDDQGMVKTKLNKGNHRFYITCAFYKNQTVIKTVNWPPEILIFRLKHE